VGNLPYQVTNADLEQMFSQYGEVQSALVVVDRETGRGRGFAFVEMSNDAEANAAIDGLHDQESGGRRLIVNEARPREARTTSYGRGNGGGRGPSSYGGRRY
jgi:RNA recognition motif-containing protein